MENKLSGEEIEKLRKIIKEYDEKNEYKGRANINDTIFYISHEGYIFESSERNSIENDNHFIIGNYYFTKEEAEKELTKMEIRAKLKRLAERLNYEKTGKKEITEYEWNTYSVEKKCVLYSFDDDKLYLSGNLNNKMDTIYCLDADFLKKAVEEIGENELKKLFI